MPPYLFAEFLRDPAQYRQAEAFWTGLFDDAVSDLPSARQWVHPWLNTRFADGTAFGDGDPIFSAWSPAHRSGLRVIQLDPDSGPDGGAIHARIDTFDGDGAGDGDAGPIRVLVISCVLDAEAAELAAGLMRQWVSRSARQAPPAEHRQTG